MTTTTLYSSKKTIFAAYKNAMIRLKGIGAFYFALSIISFPVMYFLEVSSAQRDKHEISINGKVMYDLVRGIYPTFTCLAYFALLIGVTVLVGVMVNGFMHNKKAVDVYHSLPITRPQALIANYLAAASVIILPLIISFGLVAIGNSTIRETTFSAIVMEAVPLIVLIMVMLSITFFCCVLCCASFDSAAFALSLGVIIPCFYFLKEITFQAMFFGYGTSAGIFEGVRFSPLAMFYGTFLNSAMGFRSLGINISTTLYIGYFIFAIALLLVACLLYTRRKSELAQSFKTTGAIYQFMIGAASFGCAVMLSIFTQYTMAQGSGTDFRENRITFVLLALVFGALCYFGFNTILTRSFKQTKKSLVTLSICAIAPAAYLGCLLFTGWFGYESYIPKVEAVAKVSINYMGTYYEVDYNNVKVNSYQPHDTTTLESENSISAVADIHRDIINGERRNSSGGRGQVYLDISYTLKNGKTVSRYYSCNVDDKTVEKLIDIEETPEFKAQHSPFELSSAEDVKTFEIKDGFGRNFATLNLTKEEIAVLYNAMQLDEANQALQSKIGAMGIPFCKISVIYKNVQNDERNMHIELPMFRNVYMDVTSQCYNTLQALKELKLEQYTTIKIPENAVAIITPVNTNYRTYFGQNAMLIGTGGFTQTAYATNTIYAMEDFSEKEYSYNGKQLEEMLPMLQNYAYPNKETVFQVLLVDKDFTKKNTINQGKIDSLDDDTALGYYLMTYSAAPQFIKDDFDKPLAEYNATVESSSIYEASTRADLTFEG